MKTLREKRGKRQAKVFWYNNHMKKWIILGLPVLVIGAGLLYKVLTQNSSEPVTTAQPEVSEHVDKTTDENSFDKDQYSLSDPNSIWVIVNKRRSIPIDFVPDLTVASVRLRLARSEQQMNINTQTAPAIEAMFIAAQNEGVTLVFGSGYRSGALQRQFYESYKAKDGQAAADTYSARPGHSEHQTGFSVDLTSPDGRCHLQTCWQDTAEGKWAAANAYKYGFILRYPQGKENITGYQYEPWHFRFVGKELAAEIQKTGQTLEEFFNLPAANSYEPR